MEPGSFGGIAMFLVVGVITGVIGYLAMQQSKIKKQIDESRREREREELAALANIPPPAYTPTPPDVSPEIIADITPASLPKITPGGTPAAPRSEPSPSQPEHPQEPRGPEPC